MLNSGTIGVHPPGALGVAYYMHAGAECFIGRTGSAITPILREAGVLKLRENDKVRTVPLRGKIFANLLEADASDRLPELLMVCCNPAQLSEFTADVIRFAENLAERGRLQCADDIRRNMPILLILPNGIVAEHTQSVYAEQINESVLMGRLPGVDEEMISALQQRILRGISLQAGGRRGCGRDTEYILEGKGALLFAGGGAHERDRAEQILSTHNYPFTRVHGASAIRIEFDKAMISIVLNVGGLMHAVKPTGELIDVRMGDLCKDASKHDFVNSATRAVFDVGRAIGAYSADDRYEDVWAGHRSTIMKHAGHVTSSVKTLRDELEHGLDSVKLFSNEEWTLTPLSISAANAGMTREKALFESYKRQIQQSVARAIRYRDQLRSETSGMDKMKLAAQRNISIELYEAGPDDVVLVGTLLDSEHLIKLEITVHLPDEQITRSRLNMIRSPFPVCAEVEGVADKLVGLRITRGVIDDIGERVGGRAGCSHIKELATSIVYFVATYSVRRRVNINPNDAHLTLPEECFQLTKELLQDSCLAYCQTTSHALDEQIGIKRLDEVHTCSIPLGSFERSLGPLLTDRARQWSDKVYIRHFQNGEVAALTWTEFADSTFQIARHLIEQGIESGDHIGVMSENRVEMFMLELAVMSIGAVSVPIFAGYSAPQVAYILDHARPRMLVVSNSKKLELIDRETVPWIQSFFCIDHDDTAREWGAMDFDLLLSDGGVSTAQLERRMASVSADDCCLVMYTSGTTGAPKGVQLCHRNIISQQRALSLLWDVDENDVFLSHLPWHHSFGGLFERFMTLYNGSELCLKNPNSQAIDALIESWKAYNPTLLFTVPRVHEMLLTRCREDAEVAEMVFGSRLRFVFTAGASLPSPIEEVYRENNIPVLEGWGLTETSPCVTVTKKGHDWRSGYVGFAIPGVSVKLGDDNEIFVKGPNLMKGYLRDSDATALAIDEAGWFHTGDIGEFTSRGLRILGRKDGTFKLTTGEKVHAHRLEMTLVNASPYISRALIIGDGKDFVGALIYPDFSRLREWITQQSFACESPTEAPEVRRLFATELERINPMIEVKYQRIKRAVLAKREPTLETGELTPSSKTIRKNVCEIYKSELAALFDLEPPDIVIEVYRERKPHREVAK